MTSMPAVEPDLAVPVNTRKPLLKRLLLPTLGIAALVLGTILLVHRFMRGSSRKPTTPTSVAT